MKKIVILSNQERPSEFLIAELSALFPECEISIVKGKPDHYSKRRSGILCDPYPFKNPLPLTEDTAI